jgi:predicted enzyme related to lactoylglutathione lyase
MAITGTHMLLYTTEPEKLRAMLRDVFGFTHVDAGHGWLIFRTPPGEVGVHPAENGNAGTHAISFMCDDITATIAKLRSQGVDVDPEPADHGYGIVTMMHLPGGCDVQLYEPRHPIAADIG